MRAILAVLFLAAVARADADQDIRIALALSEPVAKRQAIPRPIQSDAVARYLAQPLNVGRCPCGATGQGCHCQPHSLCKSGQCANHNPLLNPGIGQFGPFDIRKGDTLVIGDHVPYVRRKGECDPPTVENLPQGMPAFAPAEYQLCPSGRCPQGAAPGRGLLRWRR